MPGNSEQKKIDWKSVLIGAVIGAILVGLAVLIFLLLQPKSEETTPTTVPKTATTSAKKDGTSAWKTYQGRLISVEFKIPKDFTVTEKDGSMDEGVKINTTITIEGFDNNGFLTIYKGFMGGFGGERVEMVESKEIIIDGVKVNQTFTHDPKVHPEIWAMLIFISQGSPESVVINASFDTNDLDARETIDKILSTIDFK